MLPTLSSPGLLLRPFCNSDIEKFIQYRNDPEVYRFQGWKTPFLLEEAESFISEKILKEPITPGEWVQLALESTLGGNEIIGDVAFLISKSDPRQAHIGCTLARQAWGKGYAKEAVSRLLDYLFRDLNLHRVVAGCDVENIRSFSLLERLGFRREAYQLESYWLSREETWGSEFIYAILQKEWLKQ